MHHGRLPTDCFQFESSQVLEATSATTTCFPWIRRHHSAANGDPTNLSLSWKIFVSSSFLCRNIRSKQLDISPMINAPVGNYK